MRKAEKTTSQLIADYRKYALLNYEENSAKNRRGHDGAHACYKLLRESEEGRQAIIGLMVDPEPQVRQWAAGHALFWVPERARAVLEELLDRRYGMSSLDAMMCLKLFDLGMLSFEHEVTRRRPRTRSKKAPEPVRTVTLSLESFRATYGALLTEHGLGRYAPLLLAQLRPSVRLRCMPVADRTLPVGASKLGGRPDVPRKVIWPRWNGEPMGFVGQINLADVAAYTTGSDLPTTGLLSFFYDSAQSSTGYDPADRGSCLVVYTAAEHIPALKHRSIPLAVPQASRFWSCALTFAPEITCLPWEASLLHDTLAFSEEERLQYIAVQEACTEPYQDVNPRARYSRMLGHPDLMQGDVFLDCQLASHGVSDGGVGDPRTPALSAEALDWQLLLQVDSEDDAGMEWGDVGRLYFCLMTDDLRAGRFDRAWVVLQAG